MPFNEYAQSLADQVAASTAAAEPIHAIDLRAGDDVVGFGHVVGLQLPDSAPYMWITFADVTDPQIIAKNAVLKVRGRAVETLPAGDLVAGDRICLLAELFYQNNVTRVSEPDADGMVRIWLDTDHAADRPAEYLKSERVRVTGLGPRTLAQLESSVDGVGIQSHSGVLDELIDNAIAAAADEDESPTFVITFAGDPHARIANERQIGAALAQQHYGVAPQFRIWKVELDGSLRECWIRSETTAGQPKTPPLDDYVTASWSIMSPAGEVVGSAFARIDTRA